MQPGEALGVAAQVAATLAGFAGIVVVFRPESARQWSALDRFRLRLLLSNSALPLGYSLFGILLLTIEPAPVGIWRWCSGFALLSQLPFVVVTGRSLREVPAADFLGVNKLIYYPIAVLGVIAMVLQVINFAVWKQFWPFFTAVFVHLIAAIVQFLRLLLLPPHISPGIRK